jgi:hypothetical protein
MSAEMIFEAMQEVVDSFELFYEADRIEHYRHIGAVATTVCNALEARYYAPVMDHGYGDDVSDAKSALWRIQACIVDLVAHLCVPTLEYGMGLTRHALAEFIHATNVISEKERRDLWKMFETLDDAMDIITHDEDEEEDEDEWDTELGDDWDVAFGEGARHRREAPTLAFEAADAPYESPICYDEKDCECWTCPTCHTHVCHDCMDHWITTDIAFHVDEEFEWNTQEQHATCPYCRAPIAAAA